MAWRLSTSPVAPYVPEGAGFKPAHHPDRPYGVAPMTEQAMSDHDQHEVYAIRYGHHKRKAAENFILGDPHDVLQPLDFYVWAIVGPSGTIILDTGFDAAMGEKRQREITKPVGEGLQALGVDPGSVETVIISHMHYDHVGNHTLFPRARYHLQDCEMAYATGRYMQYPRLSHSFEVEDVCGIVRLNYARRVLFYDGDCELAPGLTIHAASGHSAGLQFVRVRTRRGFVVLASDVSHFYENMASERPFTTALHIGEMLEGFDKLLKLAPDESHIIPGHDPLVMKLYPAPNSELEGVAVRLDVPPSGVAPRRADYFSRH
jgi:glyoxylase-like metal-dependent hydrolase (beta-lactamase superfamily II)